MLEVLKIGEKEGKQSYSSLISSFKISNPYSLLDYIDIFDSGLDNLICFFSQNDRTKEAILMPGYLKPIMIKQKDTSKFDFVSPYGYSGPFFTDNIAEEDIYNFWKEVDNWYNENNVVTEFIRFNLSNNYLNYSGEIFPTMLNVRGKIIEEEKQWTLFDRKVRKNFNKAKRENLHSEIFYQTIDDNQIKEFFDIYILTMKRTGAKKTFFYTLEEFKRFIKSNKESCAICTIYYEKEAISSELLLISKDSIYSFLGGTKEEYFEKRPNDLLKVEVINWARTNNISFYILGGGYGMEDGIFKYKKCFFPNDVVTYYTGRKIINQQAYDELINLSNEVRTSRNMPCLDKDDTSYFPLYNKMD
jgi:hypothetical protein